MKAWIPVCLALFIAQAPVSPETEPAQDDTRPLVEPELEPSPGQEQVEPLEDQPAEELQRLRLRLQQLEAQRQREEEETQARVEEAWERLQTLEEQQATEQARALELQQLQQQRVVSLERAYGWLITVEDQLDAGNLDEASPALSSADEALAAALSSALETGRDQIVLLLERARDRISVIRQALAERDVYSARVELQVAAFEVRQAWRQSLDRPDAANLIR